MCNSMSSDQKSAVCYQVKNKQNVDSEQRILWCCRIWYGEDQALAHDYVIKQLSNEFIHFYNTIKH